MAAASVTVGGAWGSSNESALESVYMCPVFTWWTSLETTPVTGSLLFAAPGCRLSDICAREIVLHVWRDSADLLLSEGSECVGLFFEIIIRLRWRWGATARQTAGPVSTSTCSYKFFGMLWRRMSTSTLTAFTS